MRHKGSLNPEIVLPFCKDLLCLRKVAPRTTDTLLMPRLFVRQNLHLLVHLILVATTGLIGFVHSAHADDAKGLFKFIGRFNGSDDKICEEGDAGSPIDNGKSLIPTSFSTGETKFKSEGDLRRYLECYVVEPGRWKLVEKEYLPLIKTAAVSFDIPETLLACLIFRESRFDPLATSNRNAFGLGQYMPETMNTISNILKPESPKRIAELIEISKMTIPQQMKARARTSKVARESLAYAHTKLQDRGFRLKWEGYISNLKSSGLRREKTVPRKINLETLKDPKIAIGAAALYVHMTLYHLKKTLDQDIRLNQSDRNDPSYDISITAAGLYNQGYGAAQKYLSNIEPPDRKEWVEALKKSNEETAGHIISIQRCTQASANKDGDAWKAPIGSPNINCDARGQSRKRTEIKPTPKKAVTPASKSRVKARIETKPNPPPKASTNPPAKTTTKPVARPTIKPAVKPTARPAAKSAPVKK